LNQLRTHTIKTVTRQAHAKRNILEKVKRAAERNTTHAHPHT